MVRMDNLNNNVEICPKTKEQLETYIERILQQGKESTKYNLLDSLCTSLRVMD